VTHDAILLKTLLTPDCYVRVSAVLHFDARYRKDAAVANFELTDYRDSVGARVSGEYLIKAEKFPETSQKLKT
jgi:hypothetical protein